MVKLSLCTLGMVVWCGVCMGEEGAALPYPTEFDAAQYLGKWYEVARMPTAMQPTGSLATAEYRQGKDKQLVRVTNTAYDAKGKRLARIEGKAKLFGGDPPRLAVSFGPFVATKPNYYVLHVDDAYTRAVVGTPNRKSLWILSRKVPLTEKERGPLLAVAKQAGFDVGRLEIGEWKPERQLAAKDLLGTWNYVSAVKDGEALEAAHFTGQAVEITAETITLKSPNATFVLGYEMDRTQRPAKLQLEIHSGPFGAGGKAEGILDLDGDRLSIAYHPRGGKSPHTFLGAKGSGHSVFVLSRGEQN